MKTENYEKNYGFWLPTRTYCRNGGANKSWKIIKV